VQFAPYALREPIAAAAAGPDGRPAGAAHQPRTAAATPWSASREAFGDLVTAAIERYAPGFRSTVIARQVITPEDLERQHALTGGHIYHGELALDQLLLARPLLGMGNHSTPIASLFLCGSGTHPGIGLDGRSGRLAAQAILQSKL
jgi:phytoene dehydrogenase-like protein